MAWEIAAAGTLNLDDITTPHGHHGRLLGGSALYFTLSARNFARVYVHGTVGQDAWSEFSQLLQHHHVDTTGVQLSTRPTRTWKARHDFEKWVAVVDGDGGGFATDWDDPWNRRLTPRATEAQALFLGSMSPAYQLDVMRQSRARFVACDTMNNFIVHDRDKVGEVIAGSDVLFANHEELSLICNTDPADWREAAQELIRQVERLRAVVVKAGPLGAALVTADDIIKREAVPVSPVIDPTGAGDSLAGGFVGYCAKLGSDDQDVLVDALDAGLHRAAMAIGSFGTTGFTKGAEVSTAPQRSSLSTGRPSEL